MGSGLLETTGFDPKRLADAKADLQTAFRTQFGQAVNLNPDSEFGKLIDILADREASIWERMEEVYNSDRPGTASGTSLDGILEITGIKRNAASRSTVTLYAQGNLATIPQGAEVETSDTGLRFRTTEELVLPAENLLEDVAVGSGNDLVQAAGVATVTYGAGHGLLVGDYVWVRDCVQPEYNGIKLVATVPDSTHFTFAVDSGATSPATGTVTMHQVYPVEAESVDVGPVVALSGTLTEIGSPVSGWDEVTNLLDAELGEEEESDADVRVRRTAALSGLGNATVEALRGALLALADVETVKVFENDTDATVSSRPPHSFEALVVGGEDQDIWDAIFANKAAGIASYGSESGSVEDSQGISHTIKFSRPTIVEIYLDVTLTVDADYPVDGDALVKAAILAWAAENLEIGSDVVVFPYLVGSFITVPGILTVVVDIGTSPGPSGDANITIGETQLANFDSSNVTVSS